MIPYYSPHIGFFDIIKSLFTYNTKNKIIQYFKEHTGKEYILLTSSCRAALFIVYSSLKKKGEIITSPLTCRSAIDPILWTRNKPIFTDVSVESLNFKEDQIFDLITDKTIAVQIINHGGVLALNEKVKRKIKEKNILLIEDCAQSFGATVKSKNQFSYSDVLCFSLIKNAYGIGGGILATNSEILYNKAKSIQNKFKPFSKFVLLYRIIYSILETYQKTIFIDIVFSLLKKVKNGKYKININEFKDKYLKQPDIFFYKIFISRKKKIENLQKRRKEKGIQFFEKLKINNIPVNYNNLELGNSSFTKLFVYNPYIKSNQLINQLIHLKIDAKHLEQSDKIKIQRKFNSIKEMNESFVVNNYTNYNKIHDHLISLPLTENIRETEMDYIINIIKKHINEKNLV